MGRLSAHYSCALCDAPAPTTGKESRFLYFTTVPSSKLGPTNPEPSCSGHADFWLNPSGNLIPLGRSTKAA